MVIFTMMMIIIIKIIARPRPALSYYLKREENLGLLETTREATALASVRPSKMHHLILIDYQYHDHVDGNADSGDKGLFIYYVIQFWGLGRPPRPHVIL